MGFFPAQNDAQMGGPGASFRSLSHTTITLTILWEIMSICARVACLCFLRGLYRTDDTITVVLTMQSSISCNNDCP